MSNKTPTPEQLTKDTESMFEHAAHFGGGPAHPQQVQYGMTDGVPNIWFAVGMTKRERFAMAAMQGMLSANLELASNHTNLANEATAYADALLERLKK